MVGQHGRGHVIEAALEGRLQDADHLLIGPAGEAHLSGKLVAQAGSGGPAVAALHHVEHVFASFGIQAVADDLFGQVGNDDFHGPLGPFDRYGSGDEGLAAVQGDAGHTAGAGFGGAGRGRRRT